MQSNVVSLHPDASLVEALTFMDERSIRVLPILDKNQICQGLVSVFKTSKFFCPSLNHLHRTSKVLTSISILARTLDARIINSVNPEQEEELTLLVGAMNHQSFTASLPRSQAEMEKVIVIVADRDQIQEQAIASKARVVVVTGGLDVAPSIQQAARTQGVSLIVSPHDTMTTAMLCRSAVRIQHMVHQKFLSFGQDELLSDVQAIAASSNFQAFPVLNDRGQTVGVLSKSDFLKKVDRQLILVDHNELSQAVTGADKVEIIEIIDHHRIGSFTSKQPILFRNEPVGSTSSIVAECFFRDQLELSPSTAGLLLAGLVSDTLNLTSPTTTARDEVILRRLEQISGVNASDFVEKLFASGSVLTSLPAPQAILADCKEFEEKGRTFSVAQIEELGFRNFWTQKDAVLAALEQYRTRKGHLFSALLVTDVVRTTSLLLVAGPESFKDQIIEEELEPGIYSLPGVVSRKKQLLPDLTRCLKHLPAS